MIEVVAEKREDLVRFRKEVWHKTQHQAAELLGIAYGKYVAYEYRPFQKIPPDIMEKLRRFGYQPKGSEGLSRVTAGPTGTLKVYGSVSAGKGASDTSDSDELIVPLELARADFSGNLCEGDSMMPLLHSGDVLVFRDHSTPLARLVYAVKLKDQTNPVVKEMQFKDGKWQLVSWNPSYEPINLDNATVLGYLVAIIGAKGSLRIGPEEDGLTKNKIEDFLRARLF